MNTGRPRAADRGILSGKAGLRVGNDLLKAINQSKRLWADQTESSAHRRLALTAMHDKVYKLSKWYLYRLAELLTTVVQSERTPNVRGFASMLPNVYMNVLTVRDPKLGRCVWMAPAMHIGRMPYTSEADSGRAILYFMSKYLGIRSYERAAAFVSSSFAAEITPEFVVQNMPLTDAVIIPPEDLSLFSLQILAGAHKTQ